MQGNPVFSPFLISSLFSENKEDRTVAGLIRHADYIAEKIGVEYLTMGFDFCEFLGAEAAGAFAGPGSINVRGMDDCSQVPFMLEEMRKAGFSEKEMEMICHQNWTELIRKIMG